MTTLTSGLISGANPAWSMRTKKSVSFMTGSATS